MFFSTTAFTLSTLVALVAAQTTVISSSSSRGNASATATASSDDPIASVIAGINPCLFACLNSAAITEGCGALQNVTCVCQSPQFRPDALLCAATHCTPADVTEAQVLRNSSCAGIAQIGTATPANVIPFSTTVEAAVVTTSATSSATVSADATTTTSTAPTTTSPPPTNTSTGTSAAPTSTSATSGSVNKIVISSSVAFIGSVIAIALAL